MWSNAECVLQMQSWLRESRKMYDETGQEEIRYGRFEKGLLF